jgi:hypothetical protein
MDRSECVHGILHEVLWECEASSHRFSINGLLPQKRREDACALQSPATARRNTTHKNLRKLARASSSCGELRKLSSIVVRISRIPRLSFRAKSRNLSILFPILPLGHSCAITAAWQLLFVGLRSPTPAIQRTRAFRGVWPRCSFLSDPCGYARHSRLASHHELLLRSPSNL